MEGESYRVAVQAEEIGSPLDVSLAILRSDGREEKAIADSDDLPDTTDAGLEFRVPADGNYRIAIGDLSGSAGQPTAIYRLVVTRAEPAFRISVPERAETIIGAQPVVVSKKRRGRVGQAGLLTVEAMRSGGFDAPISLQLIGLPPGISVPEQLEIPQGETQVEIPIPCDEQAPSWATLVTVRATAKRDDGTEVADEALVLLAPVMMPRAIVRPYYPDAGRAVHRGATYRAPVVVERLEGYEGDVVLQLASHPDRVRQGISGGNVVAVKGISEIAYPLFLPEWVQIDRTSRISLNALVEVADARGNRRWLVNRMDRRITMNVEGALLKLNAAEPEYPIRPGQTVEVPLEVLRSAKFRGPVEIAVKKSLNQPFQAEPVTIAADQARCVFRVTASRGSWPAGEHPLTIQATGLLSDRDGIVKSETQIFLLVEPD